MPYYSWWTKKCSDFEDL